MSINHQIPRKPLLPRQAASQVGMSETLRTITGWAPRKYSTEFEDPLAFNKFVAFALVSSVLVPDAARRFRKALKRERDSRRLERLAARSERGACDSNDRVNKLVSVLLASLRPERHEGGFVFPPPHWTGEARPNGARRVQARSRFPCADYLTYLVSELAYEPSAAIAALSHAHSPWTRLPDRRRANAFNADEQNGGQKHEYSSFAPAHPYYPASPSRRTKVGGAYAKEKVLRALEQRGWNDNTQAAIFEVVYYKQSATQVAAQRGLKLATVYQYSSRLRQDLKAA
jgi:hypothetical protein